LKSGRCQITAEHFSGWLFPKTTQVVAEDDFSLTLWPALRTSVLRNDAVHALSDSTGTGFADIVEESKQ
jgi:hypothetical protein